jgi:hypothetical protein
VAGLLGDEDVDLQRPAEQVAPVAKLPLEGGAVEAVAGRALGLIPALERRLAPDEQRDLALAPAARRARADQGERRVEGRLEGVGLRHAEAPGVVSQEAQAGRVGRGPEHALAGALPGAPLDVGGEARQGVERAGDPEHDRVGEAEALGLPLDLIGVVEAPRTIGVLRHEHHPVVAARGQQLERSRPPRRDLGRARGRAGQEDRAGEAVGERLTGVDDLHGGEGRSLPRSARQAQPRRRRWFRRARGWGSMAAACPTRPGFSASAAVMAATPSRR